MNKLLKWRKTYIVLILVGNLIGILLNVFDGGSVIESLSYFTIISNILVFGFFLFLLIKKGEPSKNERSFKAAITVSIMVTFIVFHLLLAPTLNEPLNFWNSFLVHTYTPLLVLLDYFLFDKKGELEFKSVKYWVMIPIGYFLYTNLYVLVGGVFTYEDSVSRYPYFFINPDEIGWGFVVVFVVAISAFITGLSLLFVFLDHKIVQEKRLRQPSE